MQLSENQWRNQTNENEIKKLFVFTQQKNNKQPMCPV